MGEKTEEEKVIPLIHACATLWHETSNEMEQLLKSVFRYGRSLYLNMTYPSLLISAVYKFFHKRTILFVIFIRYYVNLSLDM